MTGNGVMLALAVALVVASALASDSSTAAPTFDVQWSTTFTGDSWIVPAKGQFRNGNTVGIAATYFESGTHSSGDEGSGVCQFYDILDSTPTWCHVLSNSFNNVPMILGGGDNSVFAALVNGSSHAPFEMVRWVSASTSQPSFSVTGNASAAVLGLSGNGDVTAVIEPLGDGTQAVALYSLSSTPFATGNVPLLGVPWFGYVSFGSPSPSMFISDGEAYTIVSTFTATALASGKLPGALFDVCNGGEVVLTFNSQGLTGYGYALKTNAFTSLFNVADANFGHLSIGCTTATAFSQSSVLVYSVSRTAATLQASMETPVGTLDVVPSDTGAVVVIATDTALLAWVSPYTAAPIQLSVGGADTNKMVVFEPPAPNGVLAYVMFNQFTATKTSLFLAVVNGTASA